MDPDYPVETLSLEDIEFEAGFWFRKSFPALCTVAWIVLALTAPLLVEMSERMKYLLLLGGTFLVMCLAILVSSCLVLLFPKPSFFFRISRLWASVFRMTNWISPSRLDALQDRRNRLLLAKKETGLD
ncbi:MAG: hypothetical protein DWQ34_08640 [Planctomycetota bacterium]|nr:MAG: hypothetical protein DWQ34_08640 [Planctomycetota bacterium]REK27294.1 MAG: hypothetical protein DWQ41_07965 [Planctomycetota bacterium]REK36685.1 MAG: hypothetical protein DWQ45_08670 [Planctomycetota bacterium]